MKFTEKLLAASKKNRSLLCIGLDPDPKLLPKISVIEFNRSIIEATADLVCAYKPNLAFYEAFGIEGIESLQQTIHCIPEHIPIIGDSKRSDIGNTSKAYARALFDILGFDAITVNPYLGFDSLEPFIEYKDRGIFILCRTSNPGAEDFQSLTDTSGMPLYQRVAMKAKEWNRLGNVGLVVGATYPEELRQVRILCPDMLLLIPGIGTQGGDLLETVRHSVDSHGEKAILTVSRQILYASRGKDFAQFARQVAEGIRDKINRLVNGTGQ
jgi:orotidine-5'-phosphate decarboxylase